MSIRSWITLVAGLIAVLLAGRYLSQRGLSTDTSQGTHRVTFVGAAGCAPCHADQAALWTGSHHDLAMQEADDSTVLGDFSDTTFSYAGTTSTFFRRGEAFMVRTDGPNGALGDYAIAYTFGVDPLQQYLVAFPDGRLQALGIAWDTRPASAGGQRWFHLYPDETVDHRDVLHWTGPGQTWNFMCAECHSTNLEKNYSLDTDTYDTTWSSTDVSCEACHGPGSAHVAWAETVTDRTRGRDGPETSVEAMGLTVDLADRDNGSWNIDATTGLATRSVPRTSRTQLELCARCHSRRSVLSDTYVYGRPLVDTHRPELIRAGLYHADGQIRDEVYVYGSFLQSKMYAAGVTCSECHDPHALSVRGEGNARCAGCHQPSVFDTPTHHFHETGTRGASCVECHMPATTYMVVDPRRDHSFRSPRPDLSVTLDTPNACTACHADRTPQWAADAVTRWYGPDRPDHYGEVLHAARRGTPGAADALAALARDDEQPAIVRATAVEALGPFGATAAADTVGRAMQDADPLVRTAGVTAAAVLGPARRLRLLAPLLDDPIRLVRTEAGRVLADVPGALLTDAQSTARERALETYREVQRVNADRAESHVNLGALHALRQEVEEAEAAFEQAIALNRSFVPAYVNLADLFRAQGREDAVERILERGLVAVPDAGDLHHALGLLRVRQQRRPEAVVALGRAAELMPEVPRYAYVYGVALNSTGEADRALDVLDRAHRRHPGDANLLLALATISRDRGAIASAVEYGHKLRALQPGNAQVARLVEQLETLRR